MAEDPIFGRTSFAFLMNCSLVSLSLKLTIIGATLPADGNLWATQTLWLYSSIPIPSTSHEIISRTFSSFEWGIRLIIVLFLRLYFSSSSTRFCNIRFPPFSLAIFYFKILFSSSTLLSIVLKFLLSSFSCLTESFVILKVSFVLFTSFRNVSHCFLNASSSNTIVTCFTIKLGELISNIEFNH